MRIFLRSKVCKAPARCPLIPPFVKCQKNAVFRQSVSCRFHSAASEKQRKFRYSSGGFAGFRSERILEQVHRYYALRLASLVLYPSKRIFSNSTWPYQWSRHDSQTREIWSHQDQHCASMFSWLFVSPQHVLLLQRKAKAIFQAKHTQKSFRSQFTPPKNHMFSSNQFKEIKYNAAKILTNAFTKISTWNSESSSGKSPLNQTLSSYLPENSPINVYPLGYHTCSKPDWKRRCDLPGCFALDVNAEWRIFHGCVYLTKVAEKLAKTATDAYTKISQNNRIPMIWMLKRQISL